MIWHQIQSAMREKRDQSAMREKRDQSAMREKRDQSAMREKRDQSAMREKRDQSAIYGVDNQNIEVGRVSDLKYGVRLPHIWAYIDDMTTTTTTAACTRRLLGMLGKLQDNIKWARMKIEPCKSRSMSITKVPWEDKVDETTEEEEAELAADTEQGGWKARVCPVEVGCCVFVATSTTRLLKDLGIHCQALCQTINATSEAAERGSQWLWLKRK
ncbi:unnamed protein product [Coregonus sp. 'balchen']|nr:unnamed protein product [Coregonus sp. 'balchen']